MSAVVLALGMVGAVSATDDKVTICHAAGLDGTTQYVTLTISENAVYGPGGHFNESGTPQAGHEDDYLGPCKEDEPSSAPSEDASEEPTREASEEPTHDASVEPTEDASEEPSTDPGCQNEQGLPVPCESEDASTEPSDEPEGSVEPSEDASVEPSEDASVEPSEDASVEPSEDASVEPSDDVPPDGEVEGLTSDPTLPPTDALSGNSTSGPDGSLPLVLMILGTVGLAAVVLTPARAKARAKR